MLKALGFTASLDYMFLRAQISVPNLRPRPQAPLLRTHGAAPTGLAAMAAPLSEENKLAQDLLLQMKDYTPTVRRLAASPSHPQPCC